MFFSRIAAPLVALSMALPAAAETKPPLRDVQTIDDTLYYIAIANEIAEYCESITGLRLKAIRKMYELRAQANDLGYSDTDIRAYVQSKSEQNRMRSKGEAYLAAQGVSYDKPETFCALGEKEIARSSAIGIYLRAK